MSKGHTQKAHRKNINGPLTYEKISVSLTKEKGIISYSNHICFLLLYANLLSYSFVGPSSDPGLSRLKSRCLTGQRAVPSF